MAKFELLKVMIMVLFYGGLEGFKYRARRNEKLRQKMMRENETRLNELKRELNRTLSDI